MIRHMELKEQLTKLKSEVDSFEFNLGNTTKTGEKFIDFQTRLMKAKIEVKRNPEINLPDIRQLIKSCENAINDAFSYWCPSVNAKRDHHVTIS